MSGTWQQRAFKELGDSRAVEPLIILLNDENRVVRMMTARALSAIGGEKGRIALEAALASEADDEVKNVIRESLAVITT